MSYSAIAPGTHYFFRNSPEIAAKAAQALSQQNIPAEVFVPKSSPQWPQVVTGMLGLEYRALKNALPQENIDGLEKYMTQNLGGLAVTA